MQQVQNIPGVIRILDYIDDTDSYYIVMERINSKDLFDFITEEGPLPERFASKMFSDIVKTVINCRDCGVLHRDIKDENILVDLNTFNTKMSQTEYSRSSEAPESTAHQSGSWRESTGPPV